MNRRTRQGTPLCFGLALFASMALLAPTAPALPPPPESAAARAEVRALEVALRAEGIQRAIDDAAGRLDRAGETAKAGIVRAKRPSVAFVRDHIDAELEQTMKELFRTELRNRRLKATDLKVDLMVFRGWNTGFRVREVPSAELPIARTGFQPGRSRGFPAEVREINNTAAHSMGDLHDYLADRFTLAALERIIENGYRVEVHLGSVTEALTDLTNRGFNVFGEVKTPNGNYERIFLAESPSGEIRYVVSGTIDGADRMRHLTALLRFAGPDGRGVRNDRIEIVGDIEAVREAHESTLREGFRRLPLEGSTAIIGFRQTLANDLTKRALARGGIERAIEVLGANPFSTLTRRLTRERDAASGQRKVKLAQLVEQISGDTKLKEALSMAPAEVFLSADAVKKVIKAEKTLVDLESRFGSTTLGELVVDGKLRLPGGTSATEVVATRALEHGAMRAEEVLTRTSGGQIKSVLLVNNYYGDAMGSVVRALLSSGRRNVAYFGTAGGIAEGVRVGDIHVPRQIFDFRHELASEGVENRFLSHFEASANAENALGARLTLGTRLGNVFSPAVETMPWLNDARSFGLDAVEVENSHIARAIAEHNAAASSRDRANLFTAVTISDIPGGEHTLGNSNGSSSATFGRMVDHYLRALGVDNIVLRQPEAEAGGPFSGDARSERARRVAERLIPRAAPKSQILNDRIAAILGAELTAEQLEALEGTGRLRPNQVEGLSDASRELLEAEVKKAATDKQILESLLRTNTVVSRLVAELHERHPNGRFEIRLGGGIESGTFSPGVNGLVIDVRGSNPARTTANEILPELLAEVPGAANVRIESLPAEGLTVGRGEVFLREPNVLRRLFASRLLETRGAVVRGVSVRFDGQEHRGNVAPTGFQVEELARLTLPELIVRARRAMNRPDVPLNRNALVSLLTGVEGDELRRRTTAARRTTTAEAPTSGLGLIGALVNDRVRDRIRSRSRTSRNRSRAR